MLINAHTVGAFYICMSSSELQTLQAGFKSAGGHWSTFIIWAKDRFTLGRADYQRQYEPILYGWPEGVKRHWCGARDQGARTVPTDTAIYPVAGNYAALVAGFLTAIQRLGLK